MSVNRLRRILWPRGQAWRGGLTVGVAVTLLAIAFALLYLNLSTAGKART